MKVVQTNERRIEVEVTESEAIAVAANLLSLVAHEHGKLTNPPERMQLGGDTCFNFHIENDECDTYDDCDECGEYIEDCECNEYDECFDCGETYDDCICEDSCDICDNHECVLYECEDDDLDEEFVVETFAAMNAFDRARWLKSKG